MRARDVAELQTAMVVIVDNLDFLMSKYRPLNDEAKEVAARRDAMKQARAIVLEMLHKYAS